MGCPVSVSVNTPPRQTCPQRTGVGSFLVGSRMGCPVSASVNTPSRQTEARRGAISAAEAALTTSQAAIQRLFGVAIYPAKRRKAMITDESEVPTRTITQRAQNLTSCSNAACVFTGECGKKTSVRAAEMILAV